MKILGWKPKLISLSAFMLAVFFIWGVAVADAYTVDEVVNQMELKENSMNTLRFEFDQQVFFVLTNLEERVSGQAVISKPGKIKIHKRKPQEQITVSNGTKMWVYTPQFKQAWVGKVNSVSNRDLLPQGLIPMSNLVQELRKNFNLSLLDSETDDSVVLKADPKTPEVGYKLELEVSSRSWIPVKTTFLSESARIVTQLSKIEVDPELPSALFQFKPPKGTDVIPLN